MIGAPTFLRSTNDVWPWMRVSTHFWRDLSVTISLTSEKGPATMTSSSFLKKASSSRPNSFLISRIGSLNAFSIREPSSRIFGSLELVRLLKSKFCVIYRRIRLSSPSSIVPVSGLLTTTWSPSYVLAKVLCTPCISKIKPQWWTYLGSLSFGF